MPAAVTEEATVAWVDRVDRVMTTRVRGQLATRAQVIRAQVIRVQVIRG